MSNLEETGTFQKYPDTLELSRTWKNFRNHAELYTCSSFHAFSRLVTILSTARIRQYAHEESFKI